MTNFFSALDPINTFLHFTSNNFYTQAPDDWLVVITDVEGSTKAIEAGKYKSVNTAGASSIVAIVNALGTKNFPFVFGGDGATAIIPSESRDTVEKYLRAARSNTKVAFGLNLRIGIIPHRDLIQAGSPVYVARYGKKTGPSIAFFRGEGLTLAEKWVKSGIGIIADGVEEDSSKVLQGLSCRWAPLKSVRGSMLSIIIKPKAKGAEGEAVLKKIADEIDRIVDLESPQTHPVKNETFEPEKLWKTAVNEANLQGSKPRFLGIAKVVMQMLITRTLDRFNIKLPGLDFRKYKSSMVAHSDFRKFDEQLRMVIDCEPKMQELIRSALDKEKDSLFFGIYESDAALMTCFVESLEDGAHIHFVDGSNGGYALAAKELKKQMKA